MSEVPRALQRPLAVAIVCDFVYPRLGGVEMHIWSLAQCLIKMGHKVIVVTNKYNTANGNRVGIRHMTNGLKLYYMPIIALVDQATMPSYYAYLPLFRHILIRERIDIVHGHSATSPLMHECILQAKAMGYKCIFTDHSLFGFADAASINVNKYLKFTLSNIDHCICVSHTDRENLVLRAALDPRIVSTIPNAVDAAKFTPDATARPASKQINIVMLSRLVYRKGIDLVVNVIPVICARFPEVHFIIGGDGPKKLLLEEMRERHQLHDRVELLGAVPHKNVRDVLIRGHIFLNCSLTEAFCIAILEAACCGCFVVSTRVGGVPEVLPLHMLRFADPEPDALVQAIAEAIPVCKFIDPHSFHEELKDMYNWPEVAERTVAVYAAVMAAPPTPLVERFRRYCGIGRVFGPIAVIAMALFHFMVAALEVIAPSWAVDIVPDLPLALLDAAETPQSIKRDYAALARPAPGGTVAPLLSPVVTAAAPTGGGAPLAGAGGTGSPAARLSAASTAPAAASQASGTPPRLSVRTAAAEGGSPACPSPTVAPAASAEHLPAPAPAQQTLVALDAFPAYTRPGMRPSHIVFGVPLLSPPAVASSSGFSPANKAAAAIGSRFTPPRPVSAAATTAGAGGASSVSRSPAAADSVAVHHGTGPARYLSGDHQRHRHQQSAMSAASTDGVPLDLLMAESSRAEMCLRAFSASEYSVSSSGRGDGDGDGDHGEATSTGSASTPRWSPSPFSGGHHAHAAAAGAGAGITSLSLQQYDSLDPLAAAALGISSSVGRLLPGMPALPKSPFEAVEAASSRSSMSSGGGGSGRVGFEEERREQRPGFVPTSAADDAEAVVLEAALPAAARSSSSSSAHRHHASSSKQRLLGASASAGKVSMGAELGRLHIRMGAGTSDNGTVQATPVGEDGRETGAAAAGAELRRGPLTGRPTTVVPGTDAGSTQQGDCDNSGSGERDEFAPAFAGVRLSTPLGAAAVGAVGFPAPEIRALFTQRSSGGSPESFPSASANATPAQTPSTHSAPSAGLR